MKLPKGRLMVDKDGVEFICFYPYELKEYTKYYEELQEVKVVFSDAPSEEERNCGNCKHWKTHEFYNYEDVGLQTCHKVQMFWDSTTWSVDGESRVFKNDSKAFVQYRTDLLTKPEFYCNMWEGK